MGYRTVVVLNNDRTAEWMKDPELGRKIFLKANEAPGVVYFNYGEVLEQVHADTQTLMVIDGFAGTKVAKTNWHHDQTPDERNLELLKQFAESLGYSVRKKSVTKPKTVTT